MHDIVVLPCPLCKESIKLESSAGSSMFQEYSLESAPPPIIGDLSGRTVTCNMCGTELVIHVQMVAIPIVTSIGGNIWKKSKSVQWRNNKK